MGSRRMLGILPDVLNGLIPVHLGHHDVHEHDGHVRSRIQKRHGLVAGGGGDHLHAAAFQNAAQRKDVAHVVVHHQHRLAHQVVVGAVQPLNHLLFLGRQVGDDAVQEQRRFVQQPLGRFDSLDHDAAGNGVQPRVFLGRQLLAGKYHDGQVAQRLVGAELLQHLKAGDVGQAQVENHAVKGPLAERREALLTGAGRAISISSCPSRARMLTCSAGSSSTTSRRRRRGEAELLDARERGLQALGRRRLGDEAERPARQAMLAIFVQGDDLNRNVPRRRVLLQLAEHRPAQHIGQEDIQRDGGGLELLRQFQRRRRRARPPAP